MSGRIAKRFEKCAAQNRPALVTFITAGDPDVETSQKILDGMVGAGADVIELGMPFSDPMADGPAIQMAGHRALAAGQSLAGTLDMVRAFRTKDSETPIILMGYYNPIYIFGVDAFLQSAKQAGVDGLIVVDLPAEEDDELCIPALENDINFIRLTTPTTDDARMARVLTNTSGFVYYVSMTGVTGAALSNAHDVGDAVKRIKSHTDLPIAVGFGIKTAEDAAAIGRDADGVVVGTALVRAIETTLDDDKATPQTIQSVHDLVASLAKGCVRARG